ncbi:MAG: Tat pathway signal sequence domain protein [Caulobacteraceae bacterium]
MNASRLLFLTTLAAGAVAACAPAFAQYGGGGGGGSPSDEQQREEAHKKQLEQQFGANGLEAPKLRNAGPCPFVKTLYDAARYIEFQGEAQSSQDVEYTGEIEKLSSGCAYKLAQPITVRVEALMAFGRGPKATSNHKDYRYWIAVTDRDRGVLAKETFDVPVTFPPGKDRVDVVEMAPEITIPRADAEVSGSNFEVLIGFEVTRQMAEFNRLGKRFFPEQGETQPVAANDAGAAHRAAAGP